MMKRVTLAQAAGKTVDLLTITGNRVVMKWTDGTYSCVQFRDGDDDSDPDGSEEDLKETDWAAHEGALVTREEFDAAVTAVDEEYQKRRNLREQAELARLKAKYETPQQP